MAVSTKIVALVAGGLVFAMVSVPAWAQSAAGSASAASASSVAGTSPILGYIAPLLNSRVEHKAQQGCKADSLYSAHSVVGDPDACFQNKMDVRATSVSPGFTGML